MSSFSTVSGWRYWLCPVIPKHYSTAILMGGGLNQNEASTSCLVFSCIELAQASLAGPIHEKTLASARASSDWSGWRDSNPRPPAPHAGAIPGYATTRLGVQR